MASLKDGAGSVTHLPDGSLRYRIRISGKVHSKTVKRQSVGMTWIREMRLRKVREEAGVVTERRGSDEQITFRRLAKEYLEHLEQVGSIGRRRKPMTPMTLRHAKCQTRLVVKVWGPRLVARTTEPDVLKYEAQLRAAGLSTSSIRHRLGRLSQLLQFAVLKGYLAKAPCTISQPALTLRSEPKAASHEELEAWLDEAETLRLQSGDDRPELIVLLAGDAGLRRGEILRLRCKDVTLAPMYGSGSATNMETGEVTVLPPKTLQYGWLHVAVEGEESRTKSGKGRRVPILTKRLSEALKRRGCRFEGEARVVAGIEHIDSVSTQAARVGAKLHELRRRFATDALERGENIERVRRWMGHADLKTTQRYLRVGDEPTRAAKGV